MLSGHVNFQFTNLQPWVAGPKAEAV